MFGHNIFSNALAILFFCFIQFLHLYYFICFFSFPIRSSIVNGVSSFISPDRVYNVKSSFAIYFPFEIFSRQNRNSTSIFFLCSRTLYDILAQQNDLRCKTILIIEILRIIDFSCCILTCGVRFIMNLERKRFPDCI